MKLLSDVSRCHGDKFHPKCQTCARKIQIELDDPSAWFPYMSSAITLDGACLFYLKYEKRK